MAGDPLALDASGLVKRFGDKVAVAGIDLQVRPGSWFGLVGRNGAGKTTSLRMITGLLRPDAGRVRVAGVDVWADPVTARATFGVLPDDLRLIERLTGREMLTYLGLLRGIERRDIDRRTDDLLAVLGLDQVERVMIADYSQGMRKKIGLGAALLHVPKVLFLDEPFESVDPVSARTLQEVLGHYRDSGGTIVFSSHVMDTVERVSDHVAVVHDGRIVRAGAMVEVCAGGSLEDAFIAAVGAPALAAGGLGWLRRCDAELEGPPDRPDGIADRGRGRRSRWFGGRRNGGEGRVPSPRRGPSAPAAGEPAGA